MYHKIFRMGLSLVLAVVMVITAATFGPADVITADEPPEECLDCYPIMRPDRDTIDEWIEGYNALRVATIEESALKAGVASFEGSHSMLDWVPYVPEERHQGSCGNCWVWAGTGCMEIAHLIENDVHDRLSIQFFNSAYGEGDGADYACCGGWLGPFADAYSGGFAVPWDNFNANWQDGNTKCGGSTNVPAASIVVTPRYNISYAEAFRIETHGVGQATAIASIKDFLQNNQPLYFSFQLPNDAAWSSFKDFWKYQTEDVVWSDFYCGTDYNHDPGEGGGHGVLCVGYNDEEGTAKDYWIMLNSWGTAHEGIRPNGVFRVPMNIDYDCQLPDLSGLHDDYSLNWLILEVDFANSAPKADANGPYTATEGAEITFDASGSWDPDGHPLMYRWDFEDNGTWDTPWSYSPEAKHVWCDDHTGKARVEVWESTTDEQLKARSTADVIVTNVAPVVNAGPDKTVNEGDTVHFIVSVYDPGHCDTWTYDWDFGDGNTSSGTMFPKHVYGDDGVYTATLTVTDDDGGVGTDDLAVTVNNVAPTIEADSMEQPNSQFILPVVHALDFDATATDPGSDDLTFDWDWGDTTSDINIHYNDGVGPDPTPSPEVNPMDVTDTVSHVYAEPEDYTITLTVTDDDGGSSDIITQTIHVADVEDAKHITNQYIQDLPDTAFKPKASTRKAAFDNMFNALDNMLANGNYHGMIQHLRNNIREKADGQVDGKPGNDWIIDPLAQQEICQKIDDITAYLEYLLSGLP